MSNAIPMKAIQDHWYKTPVPIESIIRDIGLDLQYKDLDNDISGWIERKDDGEYFIVVNKKHPVTRQRFTAAHELGHFIYHCDLLGQGVSDNRAYRATSLLLLNPQITIAHERQANSFAANILMPKHALISVQPDANIDDLARQFNVSVEAMRIRLGR
jgi:Zn-dependent peptidase ImmA (M78 family)